MAPRAAGGSRLRLEREHGAYRCRADAERRESLQRHGACGAAMHAACARCRCRRAVAVSTGRACASIARRCSVSSAVARCWGQHLRRAASGALRKPVAGTALGGSERCCMQRGKQQRSVRGDVRSEMTALWRCLTTTCRRVSCNRMLDDYLPSSDLLHVCWTTCCGCAVSVTALADVVKRAGGRCLMARCRRAPWRDVLDDMESESTCYSRT